MPDIKMKPAIKHTIKTLDRSGLVAVKTKDVSMQTKDRMEQTTSLEAVSPSQYASNLLEQGERDGYIATKWGTEKSVSGYRYGKQLKGKIETKRQEHRIRKQNKAAVKKHLLKKSKKNIKTSGNTGWFTGSEKDNLYCKRSSKTCSFYWNKSSNSNIFR